MARRTKEEALATRDHILDAAERVFQQRGVSQTSLQQIAQAAGVTRGAIYWHFRDKADLFNAMMSRVTLPMEQAAQRSGDPVLDDPVEFVRRVWLGALVQTANDPQVRRVFEIATHKVEYVGEMQAVRDRHVASRDRCLEQVRRGLSLAMRRGRLGRRVPARAAALGLHALIDGLIQNWMLDPAAFDLVRTGRQVLDTYLAGLAAGAAASARRTPAGRSRRRAPAPRAMPATA
jgi:TetR/AcrR family acrAB operon transcriptional repressor